MMFTGFFYIMSLTDRRATFCQYHDVNSIKKSADCWPIIGRPLPDASLMTKPLKIGGSVYETFNLGASTKKSLADQEISQNRRRRQTTSLDFPDFC